MHTIQQYEKYKDSGIAWIGEIPEHWEVSKIKHNYHVILGKMVTKDNENDENNENYLSAVNIKWNGVDTSIIKYMKFSDTEKEKYLLKNNDILIMEGGMAGTSCIYQNEFYPCYFQNSINCCRTKGKNLNKFLYYWMHFPYQVGYIDFICNKATIQHYTKEKVQNTPIVLPPLSEQEQIADYLDKKCALIDESIEKSKTSIEKLKEYKQAIITEAVTKGLNKSAPLKNSNIEWIGQIPEHWEVKKLKFVTLCNQKTLSEDTNPEQEINYIEIGSVTNENGIETFETMSFENAPSRARRIVSFGDTILSTVRTYLKAIAYINNNYDKFICSTGFAVFTPKNEILNKFLFYCLHSEWFISLVEASSVGISYPAINTTNLINFKILLPPLSEQEEIAAYLDKKCTEIDTAIQGKEKLIEKLTEYKKSLIFECVTGKRKVFNGSFTPEL